MKIMFMDLVMFYILTVVLAIVQISLLRSRFIILSLPYFLYKSVDNFGHVTSWKEVLDVLYY